MISAPSGARHHYKVLIGVSRSLRFLSRSLTTEFIRLKNTGALKLTLEGFADEEGLRADRQNSAILPKHAKK